MNGGLGAAGGAAAELGQETAQHLPWCGTCYLCTLGEREKKKKKRCFLTKTAMEFGRAACNPYKQIPFCASIILQCPWLLSAWRAGFTCRQ